MTIDFERNKKFGSIDEEICEEFIPDAEVY